MVSELGRLIWGDGGVMKLLITETGLLGIGRNILGFKEEVVGATGGGGIIG